MPVMSAEFFFIVIVVGLIATHCTLVMALWAHKLGIPRADFPFGMADLTYADSFPGGKPPYWAGLAVIYMNGIFFAFLYSTVVAQYLPGIGPAPDMLRGAIYGFLLFVASGVFFQPVFLGLGLFLVKVHPRAWITSAMVHVVFGLVCGWLAPVA